MKGIRGVFRRAIFGLVRVGPKNGGSDDRRSAAAGMAVTSPSTSVAAGASAGAGAGRLCGEHASATIGAPAAGFHVWEPARTHV